MREFARGLDTNTEGIVKDFLHKKVGQEIAKNKEFQICIRDNYINIYHNGCSILKFAPNARETNKYEIHKKYIDEKYSGNKNEKLTLSDNGDLIWNSGKSYIENVLNNPCDQLKKYVGEKNEKHYISSYLRENKPFLLDLEVAFTRTNNRDKHVADRVDMAIINEKMELQLVEVKMDWNNALKSKDWSSALKSKDEKKRKVIGQMERYKKFIDNEGKRIINSYKKIAKNYLNLELHNRFPKLGDKEAIDVLGEFADRGTLDESPHLLVIKTGRKFKGRDGKDHWNELLEQCKGRCELKEWADILNCSR